MSVLLVSLGAVMGAPARFWLDNKFRPKYVFPIGIMLANVVGSFVIGLVANSSKGIFELFAIGFAGSFTTWSTFVMDLYFGVKNRHLRSTALNFAISLFFGFIALKIGLSLGN